MTKQSEPGNQAGRAVMEPITIERISTQAVRELAAARGWPRVTFIFPTGQELANAEPDRVRYRNLLRAAEGQLREHGLDGQEAAARLVPAHDLLREPGAWEHRGHGQGLAVFCGDGRARCLVLPEAPPEAVVVGEHFHLRPLLPLLATERPFHVLALSQNRVRLLACDGGGGREVEVKSMPHSLAEVPAAEVPSGGAVAAVLRY